MVVPVRPCPAFRVVFSWRVFSFGGRHSPNELAVEPLLKSSYPALSMRSVPLTMLSEVSSGSSLLVAVYGHELSGDHGR